MPYAKREDYNAAIKRRYYRRKQWAIDFLGGLCANCGADEDLEFDHVDPETKDFTITERIHGTPTHRLEVELAKCQLLCSECHKEKTYLEDREGYATHGTRSKYSAGCRCGECRQSNAEYFRQYR